MSDETIDITIQEDPLPLVIDTGTPELTITDNQGSVTVVEADTVQAIIAEDNTKLIINNGGYSGTVSVLLEDLLGSLTRDHMTASLSSDLELLESLWTRVGTELLLTYPDGVAIQEAGTEYTDTSITNAVSDITIDTENKIDASYSTLTQRADSIELSVVSLEGDLTDRLIIDESLITQTSSAITSVVSRLDTIDGEGGAVELLQSSISQTTSAIVAEVTARETLENSLTETNTSVSLLADSVILASESVSTLDDRMASAELILGTDGVNISVIETALSEHEYSIGAFQDMLTNQWSVTIEEDTNGNTYAAGFGVLVHPVWLLDTVYSVEDTVYYGSTAYECILAHTASAINSPGSTNAATYWVVISDGVKSAFTVQADAFNVLTSGGVTPVFTVTEDGAVFNSDLVVTTLESVNYGEAGEPWFKLDPETGVAEFNNMTLTIGSGSSGYSNLSDAPTSLAEISTDEYSNLETALSTVGSNEIPNPSFESGYSNWLRWADTRSLNVFYTDGVEIALNSDSDISFGGVELVCTGRVYAESSRYIPVNTSTKYHLSASIRVTKIDTITGSNRIYVGVRCYDSNKDYLSQRYCCLNNFYIASVTDYTLYHGTIHTEGSDQDTFPPGTKYIRVGFLCNYSSTTETNGVTRVSFLRFSETEFNATNGADWNSNVINKPMLGALSELDKITNTVIDERSISASKINATNLAALSTTTGTLSVDSSITLSANTGIIKTVGKDSYTDTTPGFYLGMHSGGAALGIGDATKYMRYYNGVLSIGGDIVATENVVDQAITQGSAVTGTTVSVSARTWTTVVSLSINFTSTPSIVVVNTYCKCVGSVSTTEILVRVVKDSTVIFSRQVFDSGSDDPQYVYASQPGTDFPTSGSHTYYLQVYQDLTKNVYDPFISIIGFKK